MWGGHQEAKREVLPPTHHPYTHSPLCPFTHFLSFHTSIHPSFVYLTIHPKPSSFICLPSIYTFLILLFSYPFYNHPFIHPSSTHLFTHWSSIYPSIHPLFHPPTHPSIRHPSIHPSTCPCNQPLMRPSIHPLPMHTSIPVTPSFVYIFTHLPYPFGLKPRTCLSEIIKPINQNQWFILKTEKGICK